VNTGTLGVAGGISLRQFNGHLDRLTLMAPRHSPAEIVALGMVTPVGLCAAQTAASIRAGIGGLAESGLSDRRGNPLIMGLADRPELPVLCDELDERSLSTRHERLVRMGGTALAEALSARPDQQQQQLFLGLPEARAEASHAVGAELIEMIAVQSGRGRNLSRSRVFPVGRAAGLVALDEALTALDRREAASVVVGAVDSYWDLGLLDALDGEGRLRAEGISDGFVPGEGAAFIVLAPARSNRRSGSAQILATGRGQEPGHLYSQTPFLGEGLASAIHAVFDGAALDPTHRPATVYAGLNGESHWAKEWGVSHIRNAGCFSDPLQVEHPADCMGDPGAALGLIMLGLASYHLARQASEHAALVWCSSDRGERAAALVTL
jgi:3-oxoacyl-[acyl-carrier-protein] synthase-1